MAFDEVDFQRRNPQVPVWAVQAIVAQQRAFEEIQEGAKRVRELAATARRPAIRLPNEVIAAEQIRRALDLLGVRYARIEPTLEGTGYPDVRVITADGRAFRIEVSDVHWGFGPGRGSSARGPEEAAIRAGAVLPGWAAIDSVPGIVERVEAKCRNRYRRDGGEEQWLLLIGDSVAAPRATFVFRPDLEQLRARAHDRLAGSGFARCYLYCMLTPTGPTLYEWNRVSSWRQVVPRTSEESGPAPA